MIQLTQRGVKVPRQYFTDKAMGQLDKALTFIFPKAVAGMKLMIKPDVYKLLITEGKYVYIPRGTFARMSSQLPPLVNTLTEHTIKAELLATLDKSQVAIVSHLVDNIFTAERIAQGTSNCILKQQAGTGKTFVAAGLIAALQYRTLFITHRKILAEQATKDLSISLSCKVSTSPADNPDVLIMVINSAVGLANTPDFFNGFSLIILDEVHAYCTDGFRRVFNFQTRVIIGMTATVERTDNHHKILPAYLGECVRAEDVPGFSLDDVAFTLQVRAIHYKGPPEHTERLVHPSTNMQFTHYMNNQFARDPYRNAVAVDAIRQLYEAGHCMFIFAEEKEMLDELSQMLTQFVHYVPELGRFVGGTSQADITRMQDECRIFLTTYSYSSTGVSMRKMTAIVFYTSRKANMMQIVPRILRKGSDMTQVREIVDIIDSNTSIANHYRERVKAYMHYNATIKPEQIKWQSVAIAGKKE